MIRRVIPGLLLSLAACRGSKASLVPTPAEAAADTARATLIAALFDDLGADTLQVVTQVFPRGEGHKSAAAVVAFVVDSMGRPDRRSLTIVHVQGDSAFARAVCSAVPQLRFAPLRNAGPALALVPFIHFANTLPAEFDPLYPRISAQMTMMTTVERRDFLLDKGCRRFR